jgi:carboxyl-terminal processing protease
MLLVPAATSTKAAGPLRPDRLDRTLGVTVDRFLRNHHYASEAGGADLTRRTLDQYLDAMDPSHSVFLADDVETFQTDNLGPPGASLDLAFAIHRTFVLRVRDRVEHALELVNAKHDYTLQEHRVSPDDDTPFPKTDAEAAERWRLRIKDELLRLELAGGEDVNPVEVLTERYSNFRRDVEELEAVDVREAWLSALARCYGPHSEYYAPLGHENFAIKIGNTFEGIGASLSRRGEHTKIESLVPGGPAQRGKKLTPGDRIVGVGQGAAQIKSVVGLRLDTVVQMIRGARGTVVRLRILPAGVPDSGRTKVVRIVRDKVELTERDASLEMREVPIPGGKPITLAVINVPAFYVDDAALRRGDPDANRVTTDVRKLLVEAKSKGAGGILLDLRFNGGGSLDEAVALAGLFVDAGPIVQIQNTLERIEVLDDPDPALTYADPVVVLTGPFTASGAEILAAALQDYGRALVVGSAATHGKGTVQRVLPLDDDVARLMGERPKEGAGALKLTTAKFYRVDGTSTQLRGVVPDIVLPSRWDGIELGERTLEGALPWDSIEGVEHRRYSDVDAKRIQAWAVASKKRVAQDEGFAFVARMVTRMQADRERTEISLNKAQRKAEMDEAEKEREASRAKLGLETEDEMPDVGLEEGLRILADVLSIS